MAHSKIYMRNPVTGVRRTAPVGFSWTSFFFGPIPCIWRQDWLSALVVFGLSLVLALFGANFILWLLQGFFYNKYYLEKLANQGFQVEHWEGHPLAELEMDTGIRLTQLKIDQTTP